MDVCVKAGVCSPEVLDQVRRDSSFMPIRFVVEVNHMRLRVELSWVGDIVLYGVDMRKRLHSEFAVETTAEGVVDLIFFLGSMPYVPLVHVANGWI